MSGGGARGYSLGVGAGLFSNILFLLLFSGPPRFRVRDPEASLNGEADWVVVLNLAVWGLAGLWVIRSLWERKSLSSFLASWPLASRVGAVLAGWLFVTGIVSVAPALTLFKSYQFLISVLFTAIYVHKYGWKACVQMILWGSAILCLGVAIAAVSSGESVWVISETGSLRLRGDLIAQTGVVACIACICAASMPSRWTKFSRSLIVVAFVPFLALSLMRTAYIALALVLLLALLRTKIIRRHVIAFLVVTVLLGVLVGPAVVGGLDQYRTTEGIWSLSDRVGLWGYLTDITLERSPWMGLGYYAASRVYAPEYNADLGTAHSVFLEIFVGGGVVGVLLFGGICACMAYSARIVAFQRKYSGTFVLVALFVASFSFGFVGSDVDSGPVGICFWALAAALSPDYLRSQERGASGVPIRPLSSTQLASGSTSS